MFRFSQHELYDLSSEKVRPVRFLKTDVNRSWFVRSILLVPLTGNAAADVWLLPPTCSGRMRPHSLCWVVGATSIGAGRCGRGAEIVMWNETFPCDSSAASTRPSSLFAAY